MKIVIADDNNTDRLILKRILTTFGGYEVHAAADGQEAVELFNEVQPDLVLLDALMPNMDGYEAAIEIKRSAGERLVPIIFLTSLKEASALARCLEVGGDDFLTKPYNKVILQAKLKAFERMKSLHDEVREQRNEIQVYNDQMVREQEVAKRLFDNIAHSGNLLQPNIQHLLSPMSIFNGDLLLVAETPSGLTHILLGDFTGHGLPAAIGAMPVADIFYGMTTKGFAIVDIVSEINSRLSKVLPVGVFCCAALCEINFREKSLTVWAGGLPDGYLIRKEAGIIERIKSRHLPLGVLGETAFSVETEMFRFQEDDKLYLMSDGILESESPDGEMFGEQRLEEVLYQYGHMEMSVFRALMQSVHAFTKYDDQSDDYTIIEYTMNTEGHRKAIEDATSETNQQETMDWCVEHEFKASTLKSFDPLPLVMQLLHESPGLRDCRSRVFTILAELYTNALDHGVLALDSTLKQSAEGFAEYYQTKKQRLDELTDAFIRIRMDHTATEAGGVLHIMMNNSGDGFDTNKIKTDKNEYSGRGLALIDSLCQELTFSDDGRQVDVIFDWDYS